MDRALLEARDLSQSAHGGKTVRDNSLFVRPHEVVALVGLGEGRADMLLDLLCGRSRPTHGQVLITGEDLYKNRKGLHPNIGFVPRGDTVHLDLTVFEALDYAGRLRLPRGIPRAARRQRIDEILDELELHSLRNQRVRALNAMQRKLVSIGAELVGDPGLIFLEEPTAGLFPDSEVRLMSTLHRLAEQGRALVLTTRSMNSMMLADRVAILLAGGYQAWFGPPEEALDFFNSTHLRPNENGKENGKIHGFAEIFATLGSASELEAQQWAESYRAHPAYKRYLWVPQDDQGATLMLAERPLAQMRAKQVVQTTAPVSNKSSMLNQFFALAARNLKVLLRDRLALVLILLAPLLAAGLDLFFSDKYIFDRLRGSSDRILLSSAMLVFLAMLFGGFSWAREFRKEAGVFQRERQGNLRLLPYLLSKIWLVALFAIYQGLVWTVVHALIAKIPLVPMLGFFVTLASVALVGGILGLLASALARTEGGAVALVFIFVLPLFMFSGWLRQTSDPGQLLGWANPARMGLDALLIAGGHLQPLGSSLCHGDNLLTQCDFPGIASVYGSQFGAAFTPFTYQALAARINARSPAEVSQENYESLYFDLLMIIDTQANRKAALNVAENLIRNETNRYQALISAHFATRWAALWMSALILTMILAVVLKKRGVS